MKRLRIAGLGFMAGVLVLGAGVLASLQVSAADAAITVGSASAAPRAQASVVVNAVNMPSSPDYGLGAWSLDISYDPSVVSVADVNDDGTVDQHDCVAAYGVCNPNFGEATIRIAGANAGGLEGNTSLGTLTFQCGESEGTSPLSVSIHELADATPGDPQHIGDDPDTEEIEVPPTINGSIACITQVAGQGAAISVGDGSARVGQRDTVSLDAQDIPEPGLGAWTIDVSYDTNIVSAVSCEPAQDGLGVCNPEFDDNTVRSTGANIDGLAGDNSLADLTFECQEAGSTALTISIQVLADATLGNPQLIDAETFDGSFDCSTATAATPTPTVVPVRPPVTGSGGGGIGFDGGSPVSWLIAGLAGAGIAWLLSGAASAGWAAVTTSGTPTGGAPEAQQPPDEPLSQSTAPPKGIPVMRPRVTKLPGTPPLVEPDSFQNKER